MSHTPVRCTVRKEINCSGETEKLHEIVLDATWIISWLSDFRAVSWTNSHNISISQLHFIFFLTVWSGWVGGRGYESLFHIPPPPHTCTYASHAGQILISQLEHIHISNIYHTNMHRDHRTGHLSFKTHIQDLVFKTISLFFHIASNSMTWSQFSNVLHNLPAIFKQFVWPDDTIKTISKTWPVAIALKTPYDLAALFNLWSWPGHTV